MTRCSTALIISERENRESVQSIGSRQVTKRRPDYDHDHDHAAEICRVVAEMEAKKSVEPEKNCENRNEEGRKWVLV